MKKRLTFSLLMTLCVSATQAQDVKVLSCGLGTPGQQEPQLMGLGISPDGHYICGAIEMGNGYFAADRTTGEVKFAIAADSEDGAELRHVDNNGLAIGYAETGITYNYLTDVETPLLPPAGYRGVIGESITNDGSLMVAGLTNKSFTTSAAYSTDGENWVTLPVPSAEELGPLGGRFADKGNSAKLVSADGKVIFGFLGSFAIPMAWIRNDAGEYEPDFFIGRFMKIEDADIDNPEKPLWAISGMYLCMSNNGRYLCMQGVVKSEDSESEVKVPAVYDTETKGLTVYSDTRSIDEFGTGLYPTAIADDGTIIGTIGQPYYGSLGSFIWIGGEAEPRKYLDAFPKFAEELGEGDRLGFNMPTSISADGRYLLGYSYYCKDYNDAAEAAYYVTYVIDRGENVGVGSIATDSSEAAVEAIFNINGVRTPGLGKGINIIRMTDGTTRKIMVR